MIAILRHACDYALANRGRRRPPSTQRAPSSTPPPSCSSCVVSLVLHDFRNRLLVAFLTVPLYIMLRQQWGAIGLAIASSVAILIYVMLLGWLQCRRFEREAAARGSNLKEVPGMLGAAIGLAVATGVAIGAGLYVRYLLLQLLPDMQVLATFIRTTVLCAVGIVIYLAVGPTSWSNRVG